MGGYGVTPKRFFQITYEDGYVSYWQSNRGNFYRAVTDRNNRNTVTSISGSDYISAYEEYMGY